MVGRPPLNSSPQLLPTILIPHTQSPPLPLWWPNCHFPLLLLTPIDILLSSCPPPLPVFLCASPFSMLLPPTSSHQSICPNIPLFEKFFCPRTPPLTPPTLVLSQIGGHTPPCGCSSNQLVKLNSDSSLPGNQQIEFAP